ncbi:MAG: hypothetical protein ABSB26_06710 [Nitrososphaerales archaeon]
MVSIPGQFSDLLKGVPSWPLILAMLVVSLLLIFAGRKVVKALAFLVVGLIGASIGGEFAAHYLGSLGSFGTILGVLIGFVAGGLIGLLLVRVGIGLAVGYAAYLLTVDLVSSTIAAFVVGFVFFVVGWLLYNKILSLVTAVAGGFLLYDGLRLYGLDLTVSMVLAVLVTLAGIWVNFRHRKRAKWTMPYESSV